jgi:diguanylate cyclase (GGDEF)-like protein/PAS domain S-box-containing protein
VLGLVSLSVSVLLIAGLFGLIPNPRLQEQHARRVFCETTAVTFMSLATRMDSDDLKTTLDQIRTRDPAITSIGVREASGQLELQSGRHTLFWESFGAEPVNSNEYIVPVQANGEPWGRIEVHWAGSKWVVLGIPIRPDFALAIFIGLVSFVVYSAYLKKVLKHINPSKVVPTRVRDALNSLSEGLLVLDRNHSIVLANESFATATGFASEELIGTNPSRFGFSHDASSTAAELPWVTTAEHSQSLSGVILTRGEGEMQRTYSVSTVPVRDNENQNRGVVASFEDVTQLQRQQEELRDALTTLKSSTDEIRTQNRELEWLATRDTLTGCLNRRSFFRDFEQNWEKSYVENIPMAGVMVDIDHFKAVNDNHGHGTGDEVLRVVSASIIKTVDPDDLVCRYGGEEFTVLMPHTTLDEAELKAEKCRLAIKALEFPKLRITASLGVSALCQSPETPQDLLDQADKCLYVAKRNGRNQVVRWDKALLQIENLSEETAPTRKAEKENKAASAIPFHAVAALTSALAHRDQATAVHSRRVADMCVATAEGLLSLRECYVLEIAALLHDIGKIGIPDSILRKPGRLTPEELDAMHQYNRLGVEMVRGSFGAAVLTEIVEQHVVHYDMNNCERGAGPAKEPSISARILSIANAYDTMVSEFSYRNRMSRSQAFAELRKFACTQFDPELVERFIGAIKSRHHLHPGAKVKVTKESALSIGLLLEQLVSALDDQNLEQLADITESLQLTATTHGLIDIAKLTMLLRETLDEGGDQIEMMQIAGELLDLCRSTQNTLLRGAQEPGAEEQVPVHT